MIQPANRWSDGMPLEWENWAEGQPNDKDGTEMCVGMANNQGRFYNKVVILLIS